MHGNTKFEYGMEVKVHSLLSYALVESEGSTSRASCLTTRKKKPCCILKRDLAELQSYSERFGEEKHLFLLLRFEISIVWPTEQSLYKLCHPIKLVHEYKVMNPPTRFHTIGFEKFLTASRHSCSTTLAICQEISLPYSNKINRK
jgi:hypothetical protein